MAGLLDDDEENVTENELYEKFEKYGKVIEINKVFPHVYIKFENFWNLDSIIGECKRDGIDLHRITRLSEVMHQNIIFDRRVYPLRRNIITVTNLSPYITKAELKNLFSKKYGKVKSIGDYKRYNYESVKVIIEFENPSNPIQMESIEYLGRRLYIFDAFSIIPNYKTSVMVSRLAKTLVLEEDIYQNFITFGQIKSIVRHNFEKPSLAIVTFQDEESADKATKCEKIILKERFRHAKEMEINVTKSIGLCCKYILKGSKIQNAVTNCGFLYLLQNNKKLSCQILSLKLQ